MKFIDTNFNTSKRRKTKQSYLVAPAFLSRTGEMDYLGEELDPEGVIGLNRNQVYSVSRDENEVFDPSSMGTFEGMPITITHPNEDVTAENWKELTVGFVKNVHRQGDFLAAEAWVTDKAAIRLIEAEGIRELSCGYSSQLIEDDFSNFRQTQIVANHVALVPNGRAGSACKLLDKEMKTMGLKKRSKLSRLLDALGIRLTDEQERKISTIDEEEIEPKNLAKNPIQKQSTDPSGEEDETLETEMPEIEELLERLQVAEEKIAGLEALLNQKKEVEQVVQDAQRFVPGLKIGLKDDARAIRVNALSALEPSYKGRLHKMSDAAIEALFIQETTQKGKALGHALLKDSVVQKTDYNAWVNNNVLQQSNCRRCCGHVG